MATVLARLDHALALNTQLFAQNAVLIEQVAKLNERIGGLLPVAQRKRRKQPPTTPAADVKTAAIDAATKKAFDEGPLAPPKPDEPAAQKQPPQPTGRKPIPSHLETEKHALQPDVCSGCGGVKLDGVDEVAEEKAHQLDHVSRSARVWASVAGWSGSGVGRAVDHPLPAL